MLRATSSYPLPTYPFERQRYWIEPQKQADAVNTPQKALQDTQQSQKADSSLHARPSSQNAYFAPRNEVEQTMADIWQELLGIEQVGIQDNFFELGTLAASCTSVCSDQENIPSSCL